MTFKRRVQTQLLKIDWTLVVIILGCAAFLMVIGFKASAELRPRRKVIRVAHAPTNLIEQRIHWAARLSLHNRAMIGLKILDQLNPNAMTKFDRDLWHLTKARILVQIHDLDAALRNYNSIKRGSPFWLDSIEEKGEVTARKGQYAKALAILQTALAPQFKNLVHPHTFFVASLTHLKICDYAGVFIVSKQFKSNIKARLPKWRAEAAAGNWHARRMIAETTKALHELQIIEADTIQRMALASKRANGQKLGHISDSLNVLRFPVSDTPNQEVWRDELGHYQAQVRTCPTADASGNSTRLASRRNSRARGADL